MSSDLDARALARVLERDAADSADATGPAAELEARADEIARILDPLAEATPPVAPSSGLRERVLGSLRPQTRFHGFVPRLMEILGHDRDETLSLLEHAADVHGEGWSAGPGPDIRVRPFAPGAVHGPALAGFLWCAPGAVFPAHRHHGEEWALVLSGSARDSTGAVWSVGDLVHKPAGSAHSFEALPGSDLLAAVVVRRGFELVEG